MPALLLGLLIILSVSTVHTKLVNILAHVHIIYTILTLCVTFVKLIVTRILWKTKVNVKGISSDILILNFPHFIPKRILWNINELGGTVNTSINTLR